MRTCMAAEAACGKLVPPAPVAATAISPAAATAGEPNCEIGLPQEEQKCAPGCTTVPQNVHVLMNAPTDQSCTTIRPFPSRPLAIRKSTLGCIWVFSTTVKSSWIFACHGGMTQLFARD